MEANRFDTLARVVTTAGARRSVLRGLASAVLGGPLALRGLAGVERADAKKKKKGGKKKKPCKPACTGKTCGADGCKGDCGSCASGESCVGGNCVPDSEACIPACIGGQECQPNGQCACPPDKPLFGGLCGQTCRACCTGDDCGSGSDCRHDMGSICVCWDGNHRCDGSANGICYDCCVTEHCLGGRPHFNGFICTTLHACVCPEGTSECNKGDDTNHCVDLKNDQYNCGECGRPCGSQNCIDGDCTPS